MIGPGERPSIDVVESETISGATKNAGAEQAAKAGAKA
jgi:chemotaxis protein MotA